MVNEKYRVSVADRMLCWHGIWLLAYVLSYWPLKSITKHVDLLQWFVGVLWCAWRSRTKHVSWFGSCTQVFNLAIFVSIEFPKSSMSELEAGSLSPCISAYHTSTLVFDPLRRCPILRRTLSYLPKKLAKMGVNTATSSPLLWSYLKASRQQKPKDCSAWSRPGSTVQRKAKEKMDWHN